MLVLERVESVEARNSADWCEHFNRNELRQLEVPWDELMPLTDEQRAVLPPSLQDFQLGESSEGRHGRARARAYADHIGDQHYAEAIRLFFAEENRHAAYLARYLRKQDVELLGRSWTDFVFRRVRRLMGLELLLTVLLTAELIGEVYYRAIRAATKCPTLRAICAQLLRDERMHVRFHVERFQFLRRRRSGIRTRIQDAGWRVFFSATSLVVWWKHGSAMQLGGYSFRRFRDEVMQGWRRAVRESYRQPSSSSR
ncbi:MAG TPA: hypothetical protein VHR66_23705 [Gemmataceae bacterium]|jgi:hypothetical protein|nr:hypothetical protein [Gemmataceae bacterium]